MRIKENETNDANVKYIIDEFIKWEYDNAMKAYTDTLIYGSTLYTIDSKKWGDEFKPLNKSKKRRHLPEWF